MNHVIMSGSMEVLAWDRAEGDGNDGGETENRHNKQCEWESRVRHKKLAERHTQHWVNKNQLDFFCILIEIARFFVAQEFSLRVERFGIRSEVAEWWWSHGRSDGIRRGRGKVNY